MNFLTTVIPAKAGIQDEIVSFVAKTRRIARSGLLLSQE